MKTGRETVILRWADAVAVVRHLRALRGAVPAVPGRTQGEQLAQVAVDTEPGIIKRLCDAVDKYEREGPQAFNRG